MRKFLAHIQEKSPHDRRTHAAQIAGGVVLLALLLWIATLGIRLSQPLGKASGERGQAASVIGSIDTGQQNFLQSAAGN